MTTTPAFPFVDYSRPTRPFCGLVIVGEAPGAGEVIHGRPFVGRSGELLQASLEAVGIDRESCLVANVFRYRPDKNAAGLFFQSKRAATLEGNPRTIKLGPSCLGFCRTQYLDEIDHLEATLKQARAVLSLGSVPLWATTGKLRISEYAGKILPCRLAAVPVMATYHPAFLLRGRRHMLAEWQGHLRLAASQI